MCWWLEFEAERFRTTSFVELCGHTPNDTQGHPQVANHILVSLSQGRGGFHLEAAGESRNLLTNAGVDAPEWGDVSDQVLTQTMNSLGSQGWGGS